MFYKFKRFLAKRRIENAADILHFYANGGGKKVLGSEDMQEIVVSYTNLDFLLKSWK